MEPSTGSSESSNSLRGASKILAQIDGLLAEKSYYEAHQMYKTLSHRFITQKKYTDAANILHRGACTLLEKKETHSGTDLAMSLIRCLNKLDEDHRQQYIDELTQIHSLIPADGPERQQFVSAAIQCIKTSQFSAGAPSFHKALATQLWNEKRHHQALYHFLYASDGESCGRFLVEFHHSFGGDPFEVDLFIAQTVLQLLCLKNIQAAHLTFTTYTHNHPLVNSGPPYLLPLLNFIWFLLMAVKDGKVTVFMVLCEKYEPSINRDPIYKEYLDKIGQNYFGVPAPVDSGGFLGGIMRSLFSDFTGESDEEDFYHLAPQNEAHSSAAPVKPYASSDVD